MIKLTQVRILTRRNPVFKRFQSSSSPLLTASKKKMGNLTASEMKMASKPQKKGFSNLEKVPSTMDLEPKHILLDKLYQGYQPLMLPHSPDMLQDKNAKKPLFINILEGISLEDYDKHLTGEEDGDDLDIDEAYHTPTMMFSKYIFNKNPETERKLESLDKLAMGSSSTTTTAAATTQGDISNKVEVVGDMFSKRSSQRGRVRLQFKKNTTKPSKD